MSKARWSVDRDRDGADTGMPEDALDDDEDWDDMCLVPHSDVRTKQYEKL